MWTCIAGVPAPTRRAGASSDSRDLWQWAGVWASSLTTWPNNEFRLLAMMSLIQGRLVMLATSVFLMKSCQPIPRIIRWRRMWKASCFRKSSCRSVHASEAYSTMDNIQVWYKRSFVCSWSRDCRQTLFIDCMAVEAMPIRLRISGWHLPVILDYANLTKTVQISILALMTV